MGIFPWIDDFVQSKRYPELRELQDGFKAKYAKSTVFEQSMKRKDQFKIKHSAEHVWYD